MPDQSSAASEHALMQEITAPLEILPDDALAIVDAEFPTAMRGYDRHAVDDYVVQVTGLVTELQATRSPEAAVRRALERVGDQISGILQRAHETAEQITTQSRAEAEDRLEQARRESATMIDAAAQRVRELDADADRIWAERQRIIADAEDLSSQMLAVARDATERFPPDDVRPASVFDADADADADPDAGALGLDPDARGDLDGEPEPDAEPVAARLDDDGEPGDDALPHEIGAAPDAAFDAAPDAAFDAADDDDARDDDAIDLARDADAEARPEIEQTRRFEPLPRRLTDDDSTQIIPPASDAAQHRRDG